MNPTRFVLIALAAIFIIGGKQSFAQYQKTDSIQILLNTTKEDSSKINILNNLSTKSLDIGNYENALVFAKQALKLSEQTFYFKGSANSLNNIGHVYYYQGNYSKALEHYFKALKINEEIANKKSISSILGNIGLVYNDQSDYPKALEYYEKALRIAEELNDKEGVALHLGNIGNIFNLKGDYNNALKYYFKCISLNEEQKNNREKSINLNNVGIVYCKQGNYDKALGYFMDALTIRKELGDKRGIEINLGNIGDLYMLQNKYKEAEEYLLMALKSAIEIKDLEGIAGIQYSLSELYEKQNQMQLSLDYYKQYVIAKDSLFNETKSKQITEMQIKYDVDKKEKELILLKKENQIAEYKKYLLISILVFVCLLALLLINRQRINIKKHKEMHLMAQNLAQKELERNQLETQNLEVVVQLKQEKLTNYTNLLKEKTRLLDKLQEQVDEMKTTSTNPQVSSAEHILTTIKENLDPNEYWEEFITNFNLVYKDFFDQLKIEFPDLTRNELRLCALLRCNLGNKEIANILNITPDSVKKARNRIRKKFELDANENLTKFILDIN